jgi:hypothetical protein
MADCILIAALLAVCFPLVLLGGFLTWVTFRCGMDMLEERRKRLDELAVRDAIDRNGKR